MPNRDDQETVIVQELIDERFRDIFEACSTNKATIIMLVLNHTQEHLYSERWHISILGCATGA